MFIFIYVSSSRAWYIATTESSSSKERTKKMMDKPYKYCMHMIDYDADTCLFVHKENNT